MRVEPDPAWSLFLPQPGVSSKVPIHEQAEAAVARGLEAAEGGRWEEAIAAFKEARERAHASPSLYYNLGLAYQRGGHRIQAALWYRAWLAAEPDSPKAPVVRFETNRLILETEAYALKLFDEAEALAGALSDKPPSRGAKSLRQKSLEAMALCLLAAGLEVRGNSVLRKVASLPGAGDLKKPEYRDRHGLYGATNAWDTRRAEGDRRALGQRL